MAKRLHLIAQVLFLAVALTCLAVDLELTWRLVGRSGDPGWLATTKDDVVRIAQVERDGPAVSLRPGDEVVAIDGRGITHAYQALEYFFERPPDQSYRLTFRRDGRTFDLDLKTGSYGLSWLSWYLMAQPFIVALFLAVGLAVYVLKPHDRQARLLAMMFALFAAGSSGGAVPVTAMTGLEQAVILTLATVSVFFWPAFFHFFLVFPETSPVLRRIPRLERLLYLPAIGILLPLLLVWHLFYSQGPVVAAAFAEGSPALRWVLRGYLLYLVAGLLSLVLNYRQASRASRRKLRVVVAGSFAGFLPLFLVAVLDWFVDILHLNPDVLKALAFVIVLSLPLAPLSFAYAIVRHQVIPVGLILRRSLRYLLVSRGFLLVEAGVVAATLVWMLTGSRAAFLDRLGPRADALAVPAAVLAVVGILTFVHRRVMPLIDRRFFREPYDAQRVVAEVGQSVRTAGTVAEVLDQAVSHLQAAVHAESAAVFLRRDDGGEYLCAKHSMHSDSGAPGPARSERWREVLPAGSPVLERLRLSAAPMEGENGELFVPIVTKGELLGVLALGPRLGDLPFTRTDRALASAVAWQMAFAIENTRLIRRVAEEERLRHEVEIASAVQRRLFPERPPDVARLDLAGVCHPALGVGGDYYDFLTLADGRLGIAVADVAGKGISAALLMSIVQASLRSQAETGDPPLTELVASLNRLLYRSTERNSFATFFYALFDPESRRLAYVNAGHNPPFLLRLGTEGRSAAGRRVLVGAAAEGGEGGVAVASDAEGSSLLQLRTGGLVIGAVHSSTYEQDMVQLAPGDVLVAYTDGVTEAFNSAWEEFGEERLLRVVRAARHLPAAAVAEAVVASVRDWCGEAPQHDDITLVVAKVR